MWIPHRAGATQYPSTPLTVNISSMLTSRRTFLQSAAVTAAATCTTADAQDAPRPKVTTSDLDQILSQPVLKLDALKDPILIDSIELLRNNKTFLLRTRSKGGVEAITV